MQSGVPSSRQLSIYEDIKRSLSTGDFAGRLPSLRQLALKYDTSFGTVRQSLVKLEFEGYIKAGHGKGYFVLSPEQKQKQIIVIERTGNAHLFSRFLNNFQKYFASYPNISIASEDPRIMRKERSQSILRKICENPGEVEAVFFDTQTFNANFTEDELVQIMGKTKLFHYFFTGDECREMGIPGISTDWYHGGYMGTRHLIEVGCRNILVIAHVKFDFTTGCSDAAADSTNNVKINFHDIKDAVAARRLLAEKRFDGIFALGDNRLLPVMPLLSEFNLKIPRDIAVLGYYNTPWTVELGEVPLSSVSIREDEMIDGVCNMCMGKSVPSQTIIKPKLVLRESTLGFRK